jgi:hypothetical protein
MPRKPLTFDDVRALGLALPEVEESTTYGSPALKVRGKAFACVATNKAAEPNTLGVWMDVAERDELIAAAPDVYYLKDHYASYPIVLVRLGRVERDALRDLLIGARAFVLAKSRRPRRGSRRVR